MKKSEKLDIGHLHNMHRFKKGYYVYIGSASLHRFSNEFISSPPKQALIR